MKMRPIDAERLISGLADWQMTVKDHSLWDAIDECIEAIAEQDAVPVVRCKDCKYWRNFGNEYHFCDIFTFVEKYDSVSYESCPDDFCSRGERRK